MADPVAAYLAQVWERYNEGADYPLAGTAKAITDSSDDVPRLHAALDAVLTRHQPLPSTVTRCSSCRMPDGGRVFWPCPEYQAISAALLGE